MDIPPPPPKRLPGQCFHMNIAILGDEGVGKSLLTERFSAVENFDRLLREARNHRGDPVYCYDFEVARSGAPAHHYMLSQTSVESNGGSPMAATTTTTATGLGLKIIADDNNPKPATNNFSTSDSNTANLFSVSYRKGSIFQSQDNQLLSVTSINKAATSKGASTSSHANNLLSVVVPTSPAGIRTGSIMNGSASTINKIIRTGAGDPWETARVSAREAEAIIDAVPSAGRKYVPTDSMQLKRVQINIRGCVDAALHRVFLIDTPGDEDRLSIIQGLFERKTLEDGLGGAIIICDPAMEDKHPKRKALIDRRRSSLYGKSSEVADEQHLSSGSAQTKALVDPHPADIRLSPSTPTISSFAEAVAEHSRVRRGTEMYASGSEPPGPFLLDGPTTRHLPTPRSNGSSSKSSPFAKPTYSYNKNDAISDNGVSPLVPSIDDDIPTTLPLFTALPPQAAQVVNASGQPSNESSSRRPLFFNTIHSEDAEEIAFEGVTAESAASLTVEQIPPYLHRAMAMLHLCTANEVPAVILHVGKPPNPTAYSYMLHRYDGVIYRAVTLQAPEGPDAEQDMHKVFLMQARSLVDFSQYVHNYRIESERQMLEEYNNKIAEAEKQRHRSYSRRLEEVVTRPLKYTFHADATHFEDLNTKADHVLKVRLLGAPASGKTAFLHALLDNHRVTTYEPSTDLDVATCVIELKGRDGQRRLLQARANPAAVVAIQAQRSGGHQLINRPPALKLGDSTDLPQIKVGPRESFLAFDVSGSSTRRDGGVSPAVTVLTKFSHTPGSVTPPLPKSPITGISTTPNISKLTHARTNLLPALAKVGHRKPSQQTQKQSIEQSLDDEITSGSQFYGKSTKHVLEQEALQAGLRLAATTRFANGKVVASTSRLTAQGSSSTALDNREIAKSTKDIIHATAKQCRVAPSGAEESDILSDAMIGSTVNTVRLLQQAEGREANSSLPELRVRAQRKSCTDGPSAHAAGQRCEIFSGAIVWTPTAAPGNPFSPTFMDEDPTTSPTTRRESGASIAEMLQNRTSIFASNNSRHRASSPTNLQRLPSSLRSYMKRNSAAFAIDSDNTKAAKTSLLPPSDEDDEDDDNAWEAGSASSVTVDTSVDTSKLLGSERLIRAKAAAELARRTDLENRDTMVKVTFFDGKKADKFATANKKASQWYGDGAADTSSNPLHSFSESGSADLMTSHSAAFTQVSPYNKKSLQNNKEKDPHALPPFNIAVLFVDAAGGKQGLVDAEIAIAEEPTATHLLCILTKAEGTQAAKEASVSTTERRRSKFKRYSVIDSLSTRKSRNSVVETGSAAARANAAQQFDPFSAINVLSPEEEITYDEFDDFAGKLNAFSVVADARECHRSLIANFITAIISYEGKLRGRIQRKVFCELEPSKKMALSDSIYNALLESPSDGITKTITGTSEAQLAGAARQAISYARGPEVKDIGANLSNSAIKIPRRITIDASAHMSRRMSSPRATGSLTPDRRRQSVVTFATSAVAKVPQNISPARSLNPPQSSLVTIIPAITPESNTPPKQGAKPAMLPHETALRDLFTEIDLDQDGFIDGAAMRDLHNRFDRSQLGSFKTAVVGVLERGGRLAEVQMLLDANTSEIDARKQGSSGASAAVGGYQNSPSASSFSQINHHASAHGSQSESAKSAQLLSLRDMLQNSAAAASFDLFAKLQGTGDSYEGSMEAFGATDEKLMMTPYRSTILVAAEQKQKYNSERQSEIETGFESEFEKMIRKNAKSGHLANASPARSDRDSASNRRSVQHVITATSPRSVSVTLDADCKRVPASPESHHNSHNHAATHAQDSTSWLSVLGNIRLTFDEFAAILMAVAKM